VARRTQANRFAIVAIAILLAVIGVLSWRLEEADGRPDISAAVRADRPVVFLSAPGDRL
jgi:hypothetical protein